MSTPGVSFVFGVHNHQPVGNFDFVFEKAYTQAYLPFLDAMDRYPKLHWNLHATGILWRWLEDHHPEYLDRIQGHLKAGRVELLSGGFYEPILAVLPDRDKRFQIETMQRYLEDRFHVTPKGAWLAERVWEPHLTSVLADCGIQYTLLDDAHFLKAGLSRKELCGHFVTEEQGQVVHVFPIRQDLRYAIPFQDPGVTLNLLRSFVTPEANQSLVMVDDGEKFGLWPETYKHVYEDRWLDQFLTVLDANRDWLKTDKLETIYSTHLAKGRVYLPTTSYAEMGEWTLGFQAQQQSARLLQLAQQQSDREELVPFVGGGYWRQFLTKYEEANRLHKKMIYVSAKVQQACQAKRVTAEQKKKMQMHLSAGQCNCGYWHGVFGGLYLPHLRTALYHELIEAETLADEVLGRSEKTFLEASDWNKDGLDEWVMQSRDHEWVFEPAKGGSLFEWDWRPGLCNVLNVMTRRAEVYHELLRQAQVVVSHDTHSEHQIKTIHDQVRVKEPDLLTKLQTDWYPRVSLLDHFFKEDTTLDQFYRSQYGEQGNFVNQPYQVVSSDAKTGAIVFKRDGRVWVGGAEKKVTVQKRIAPIKGGLQVSYEITSPETHAFPLWFGVEMNWASSTPMHPEPAEIPETQLWVYRDPHWHYYLQADLGEPMAIWQYPIETISQSEEGFERTYQGTSWTAHRQFVLEPGTTQRFLIRWEIHSV